MPLINAIVSKESFGCLASAFDLCFQNKQKNFRCERRKVSGCTMKNACFHVRPILARSTRRNLFDCTFVVYLLQVECTIPFAKGLFCKRMSHIASTLWESPKTRIDSDHFLRYTVSVEDSTSWTHKFASRQTFCFC